MKKLLPLLLALPLSALAQTFTYTGANNSYWRVGENWEGGSKPSDSQIAFFNANSGGAAGSQGTVVGAAVQSVGGILFNSSVAKRISINSGVSLSLVGTVVSSTTTLINNSGNHSFTITGDGSLILAGSGVMNVTNSNRGITLTVAVGESGGARQIIKTGAGTLSLHNTAATNSTFSGGVRVEAGTLSFNVGSTGVANAPTRGPLGTGTLTLGNGTTFNYGGSSVQLLHNSVSVEGNVSLGNGSQTQRMTLEGSVNLNGAARTLTVDQTVYLNGAISNGGLTKAGASELRLSGVNTYTGATTISSGTLTLAGSGALASSSEIHVATGATFAVANSYALASGQRLEGTGTVAGTLRTGNGTLAPGGDAAPGALHVAGNAEFAGGAIELRLGETAWDQLLFAGDGFSLSGNTTGSVTLRITDFDGSATEGEYLLISTAGLTNATYTNWGASSFQLDTLPQDWVGALRMGGDGLYFDLQAIPEPSAVILLGAAGAALLLRRRKGGA